jgi:hypothetical protein
MTPQRIGTRLASTLVAALLAWTAFAGPALAQLAKAMEEAAIRGAGGRQLTGQELRQLLLGNTRYDIFLTDFPRAKTGTVIVRYFRDERTRVQLLPDNKKDVVNWWIEGNNQCSEQKVMNIGHLCVSAWDFSGTSYLCEQPSGRCYLSFRVVPGNPEGL